MCKLTSAYLVLVGMLIGAGIATGSFYLELPSFHNEKVLGYEKHEIEMTEHILVIEKTHYPRTTNINITLSQKQGVDEKVTTREKMLFSQFAIVIPDIPLNEEDYPNHPPKETSTSTQDDLIPL